MTVRGSLALVLLSCVAIGFTVAATGDAPTTATVIQTSRVGDQLAEVATPPFAEGSDTDRPVTALDPAVEYRTVLGFGG